jgi:hypothetical protein
VPQEVTVQTITWEGHVESCASVDDIWVGDVGIVFENFLYWLAKDSANVSEVWALQHIVWGQGMVAAMFTLGVGFGRE